MTSPRQTTLTSTRKTKKAAKADPDISPAILRAMVEASETHRDRWITGTHADLRAMARLDRRIRTTHKRKTHG